MLRSVLFLLVGLTGILSGAPPMNVVIIQTDEHNFRTLGCYRKLMAADQAYIWGDGVKVDTPNIDWLADRGAICDRFYATSPVCTPSRASLMTGMYPQNTGAISNDLPMKDEMETFAAALGRSGYATGYIGKWHLDGEAKPGWQPERKFGFEDNRFMFNRGHWKKLGLDEKGPRVAATDEQGQPSYGVDGADEKSFTTDFLTDRAIEFVNAHRNEPFCVMLSLPDPHGPNTVRAPYDTMFDETLFRQPASALAQGKGLPSFASVMQDRFVARQMALYFGMVKCVDDNVGRLLDSLRPGGLLDHTLVIFTSDHGDMCGEHGRYNKGIPCEGSARIPFVIHAPGLIPAGTVLHAAMGTVDFKPTLLGLLGVAAENSVEGRDLSGLFRAGHVPEGFLDRTFVRIGNAAGAGNAWMGIFSDDHKFVVSAAGSAALFDLRTDPNELCNLIADPAQRPRVRELGMALRDYAERHADPLFEVAPLRAELDWASSETTAYPHDPVGSRAPGAEKANQSGKAKGKGKARTKGKGKGKAAKGSASVAVQ